MKIIVMKTLRMIGMAFVAVFLCMACSSDDEGTMPNGPGGDKTEKKLIKFETHNDIEHHLFTFSYDEENRVTTILEEGRTYNNPYHIDQIIKVKWHTDSINCTKVSYGNESKATIVLKNGLITKNTTDYLEKPYYYTYNTSGQISAINYGIDNSHTYTCSWDNGKITRLYDGIFGDEIKFEYENKTCKGFFPLYSYFFFLGEFNFMEITFAHPEILGLRNNNLPWKTEDEDYGVDIWLYTLDEDGYIKACRTDDGRQYTFEWE